MYSTPCPVRHRQSSKWPDCASWLLPHCPPAQNMANMPVYKLTGFLPFRRSAPGCSRNGALDSDPLLPAGTLFARRVFYGGINRRLIALVRLAHGGLQRAPQACKCCPYTPHLPPFFAVHPPVVRASALPAPRRFPQNAPTPGRAQCCSSPSRARTLTGKNFYHV
jgi:hypothetical protein